MTLKFLERSHDFMRSPFLTVSDCFDLTHPPNSYVLIIMYFFFFFTKKVSLFRDKYLELGELIQYYLDRDRFQT
jgi:hypothetical protein